MSGHWPFHPIKLRTIQFIWILALIAQHRVFGTLLAFYLLNHFPPLYRNSQLGWGTEKGGNNHGEEKNGRTNSTPNRVTFKLHSPEAQEVLLAGNFNSWNPHSSPLKRFANGVWKKMVTLAPGRYEYRYVVDGRWLNDPACTVHTGNPFGSENCILMIE